jgi:hypothetical protein
MIGMQARRSNMPMPLLLDVSQHREKNFGRDNRHTFIGLQGEQIKIAGHDIRRLGGNSAGEDHIIIGVADNARQRRQVGDDDERAPQGGFEGVHFVWSIGVALLQARG